MINLQSIHWLRYLTLFSVVLYFIFDYLDGKVVKDEREELIRLKTYELMQKLTMWSLTFIAITFTIVPEMPAVLPVMVLIFASMYGEIGGKLYFRRKY